MMRLMQDESICCLSPPFSPDPLPHKRSANSNINKGRERRRYTKRDVVEETGRVVEEKGKRGDDKGRSGEREL